MRATAAAILVSIAFYTAGCLWAIGRVMGAW